MLKILISENEKTKWVVRRYIEVKDNIKNPYDSNAAKPVDWSNGRCPPANSSKGQIILGYAHKNNTCGMGGNVSCIKANIGDSDKDGNDDYLEKLIFEKIPEVIIWYIVLNVCTLKPIH